MSSKTTSIEIYWDLDRALGDTYRALARMGRLNDVVVMTYSEFGRRVRENGARGTDHGSAASHLMIGGALPGAYRSLARFRSTGW